MNRLTLLAAAVLAAGSLAAKSPEDRRVEARENAQKPEWKSYEAKTVDRLPGFNCRKSDPKQSVYGGWMVDRQEATGFFRTQKIGDRWWLIDPEGWPFIHKAVAVFTTGGSDRQKKALEEKFGTRAAWAADQQEMLRRYGFNGLGAWSDVKTVRESERPMPYTVIVSPMGMYRSQHRRHFGGKYKQAGWQGYRFDLAMVFDPGFDAVIDRAVAPIAKYRDDKYLLGYFTDNEIPWKDYALDRCLEKWPETHINHRKAQEWLDLRKGKTGAKLSEATDADRRAFIAYCLDIYLEKVTAAIKKYDPNHLYLGCRFNQWNYELVNDEIFKTAGKYMDIVSINHDQKWEPDAQAVQNWGAWSGKPFFVTEFYTKGEDSELPNNTGAGWNVRTQAERGYFYQNFALKLIESKVCVGWHWFTYQDNDPENENTDPSNRDSNKGMVTWDFQYYTPLLDNMEALNGNVYQLTRFYDAQ